MMDRTAVARELLGMARELLSMDFPTQDAMDKYLKEHPDADRSNHRVVKTEKEAPAKQDEPKKEGKKHPADRYLDEEKMRGKVRVDDMGKGHKRLWFRSEDDASKASAAMGKMGVADGKEGWEYMPHVGKVQHVYALKFKDGSRVRIVGPQESPEGQFSDLKSLEREIRV